MNKMSRNTSNDSFDDDFEDLTNETVLEEFPEEEVPINTEQKSYDEEELFRNEDDIYVDKFGEDIESEEAESVVRVDELLVPDSTSSDIDVIYEDDDSSDDELSTASLCSSSVVSQMSNLSYLRDQYLLEPHLNPDFINEDLSDASSLNYRELELELNSGPRAYVHTPNIGLNGKLNLILILSVFTVVGLGIGNYIGWANHWEHQKQLSLGQILKLKQLQDELVVCMQSQTNNSTKTAFNDFKDFSFLFFENEIPLKRLKKYSFDFSSAQINKIRVFSETYKNSLESLKVNVGTVGAIDELNVLFEELTKLSKLKNLRISMNRDNPSLEINNSSVQHLRRIGENCPQISGLELQLNTNSSEINQNIFNALNDFKNLRKLRITLNTSDKSRPFLLTSKMLNNLKNLSHLTINGSSDGSLLLNDEFFESIESHLPKLQHLSFESTDITERTVESISKLKDLKSVDIRSQSMEPISDSQVMEVIRNCPKLKYFNLNNRQMSVNLKGKELKKMRKNQRTGRPEESGRRKGWFYGKRYEL